MSEALQPGGLCGAVPEDQADLLQLASFQTLLDLPDAPIPHPPASDGAQPDAANAVLHTPLKIVNGQLHNKQFFTTCADAIKYSLRNLRLSNFSASFFRDSHFIHLFDVGMGF